MNQPFRKASRAAFGAHLLAFLLVAGCARTAAPSAPAPPGEAPRPAVDNRRLVRLGVLMPEGGPAHIGQYAAAVLEGVQVAVAELASDTRFRVEPVVREASVAGTAAAVRALAEAGVVAIVAPVADDQLAAAAAARTGAAPVIVAPTGTRPAAQPQVYPLNVPDTLGAAALGEHAARSGLAPAGVLRSRQPAAQAQARAFTAAYVAAGGRAPLELTYQAGTTTFGALLRRFRDARVRALFVAADERDVRQIVPQVEYYGLAAAQVLATGAWATPDGIARMRPSTLEGVLVTLPFLPADSAGGWLRFQAAYENHFRRRLDNPIPALGYDAARLALAGLGARGSAAEVATSLAGGAVVEGATGRLQPGRGAVLRRPVIVRIREGRFIPVPATVR